MRVLRFLGLGVLLLAGAALGAVPTVAPVQGYLTDGAGAPLNATVSMRFALYADATTTTALWAETQSVPVVTGVFLASLGRGTPLPDALFRDNTATFLGITVSADTEMTPRLAMQSVPYALHAAFADDVARLNGLTSGDFARAAPGVGLKAVNGGLAIDPTTTQARVSGTCAVGSAVRAVAADGTVTCESTVAAAYTASSGLTLSGRNFSADTAVLQARVAGTCSPGSAIMRIAADGTVTCQSVTTVSTTVGAAATDICMKAGTSLADASVNGSAKLLSLRTGIGGTEVERFYVNKNGTLWNNGPIIANNGSYDLFAVDFAQGWVTANAGYQSNQLRLFPMWPFSSGPLFELFSDAQATVKVASVAQAGRVDQAGTDSSGVPGAATINKPTGVSAIAAGASSVVITNSLATPTSRVMVTWNGDHGATRWWVSRAAGSFTVVLSSAATANTSFSWEVASML